jgi:hypothetical protein
MKKLLILLLLLSTMPLHADDDDKPGPQGIQGPAGPAGPQGNPGLAGPSYSHPLVIPAIDIDVTLLESKKMDVAVFNTFMFNEDMMGVRLSFKPFHKERK